MFIRYVDAALESWLRTELPIPSEVGDISFDTPSSSWSATVSRPTVNLFLFDITRSSQPHRASVRRLDGQGVRERRAPQPMIELNYLVSAWGGSPLDRHQLLGEVISRVAGLDQVPSEYVGDTLESSILLSFVEDDRHRARDIWTGAGNNLNAGFSMHITVAADTFGWTPEPPAVVTIEATAPPPDRAPAR